MPTLVTTASLTEAAATELKLSPGDEGYEHIAPRVTAIADLMFEYHGLELDTEWPAHRALGASAAIARWHRRRNSPDTMTIDQGYGPMYFPRYDPDMSMLLGLDRFMKPKAI